MRPSPLRLAVPAALAGLALVGVTSAAADTQLEPEPCVITLAPGYSANADGTVYVRPIPDSVIACPGFAFNSQTMDVNASFQDAAGNRGPTLQAASATTYDAAENKVITTTTLELLGSSSASPTGVFTTVAENLYAGGFWITNPADSKNYRLVLAAPFTVTRTTPVPPACTLNLDAKYAYQWDQENYFVIPDSAVQCTGFTYTSASANLWMSFSSKVMGEGTIFNTSRRVYDRASGTYSTVWELRLSSYNGQGKRLSALSRENGIAAPSGSGGWTWGRFNQDVNGATVSPFVNPNPLQTSPEYRLTLAKSFAIKRATDVTAKARRTAAGNLRVNITADRNASFQNTTAPTYRRQTVLPATPADHAIVKRGSTVVKRVKLSVYGKGSVVIPDAPGRNPYTVTMVETDDNFAGTARFVG